MGYTLEMKNAFDIWKSINTIHWIKRIKGKNRLVISTNEEHYFMSQHPFLSKILCKWEKGKNLLNMVNDICEKATDTILQWKMCAAHWE